MNKTSMSTLVNPNVRKSMKGNRGSGTKPELLLSRLLGKEIGRSKLPGRPDLVYENERVVVFLNGCFWHRCTRCAFRLPKTNSAFWSRKFERNRERDRRVKLELEALGWKVVI